MRSTISIFIRTRCKRLLALALCLLLIPRAAGATFLTDVGLHIGIISVATTRGAHVPGR